MGDFRFHFTAKFSMGDFEDKCNMSLNYDDDRGIDSRVREWLENCFEKGSEDIRGKMYDGVRMMEERQREEAERAELKRLQEKYGASPPKD